MTAICYHTTLTASTNLQPVRAAQGANLKGFSAINPAAGTGIFYLKIYWFTPTTAVPTPIVGTTIPNLTIAVNSTSGAGTLQSWPDGITGNGQMWMAATTGVADTDTGALSTSAGAVVTLLVE